MKLKPIHIIPIAGLCAIGSVVFTLASQVILTNKNWIACNNYAINTLEIPERGYRYSCEGLTNGVGMVKLVVDNDYGTLTKEEWESIPLVGDYDPNLVFCSDLRLSKWENWKGATHNTNDKYSFFHSEKLGVMTTEEWNGQRWYF